MIAVAEKPSLLTRFRKVAGDQLSVIGRMPQGSTFNDSYGWADNCAAAFPFRFRVFLASNVMQLHYAPLSFFLEAFRSTSDATPTATSAESGHSHSHNHSSAAHAHSHPHSMHINGVGGGAATIFGSGVAGGIISDNSTPTSWDTDTSVINSDATSTTPGSTGTNAAGSSGHNHTVDATLVAGIYEGSTATNVKVKVNGTDRTVALGGPAGGFTTSQTELALDVAWLTLGAWNVIELTPSNLGRLVAHLRLTGFVQSA